MSKQTIHFLIPPPPQKVYTCENNKIQAKKLKVDRKNVDFHRPPPPTEMVYTLMIMLTLWTAPYQITTQLIYHTFVTHDVLVLHIVKHYALL